MNGNIVMQWHFSNKLYLLLFLYFYSTVGLTVHPTAMSDGQAEAAKQTNQGEYKSPPLRLAVASNFTPVLKKAFSRFPSTNSN